MWIHNQGGATFFLCVHKQFLVIEKDICDCQNVSVKLPSIYFYLSSRDPLIFSARVYPYILVFMLSIVWYFPLSMWSQSRKFMYKYLVMELSCCFIGVSKNLVWDWTGKYSKKIYVIVVTDEFLWLAAQLTSKIF